MSRKSFAHQPEVTRCITMCQSALPHASLKPSCGWVGGVMVCLEPNLYVWHMTAAVALMLKDAGFVGCVKNKALELLFL